MLYLLLCIAFTAILFLQFRLHPQWQMRTLQVVAVNYIVCVICGLMYKPALVSEIGLRHGAWVGFAALQGFMFFSIFSLTGMVTQRFGMGYASLVAKISVVIPLLISVYALGDKMATLQWAGITCALVAIVLVHVRFLQRNSFIPTQLVVWGGVLFVGSGIVDANFKVYDYFFANTVSSEAFTTLTFAFAGLFGISYIGVQYLVGNEVFGWQNLAGGVLLGVPNFFSVLFLVKSLQVLPGSIFYPANNIGLLVTANLIGVVLFHEKPEWSGWLGLGLAIFSIVLILV